eukprot:7506517-Ditylum_brightwellii.AAC.1
MSSRKTNNDSTVLCFTKNDESNETYQSAECKGSNYNHVNDNDNNNVGKEYNNSEEEEKEDAI